MAPTKKASSSASASAMSAAAAATPQPKDDAAFKTSPPAKIRLVKSIITSPMGKRGGGPKSNPLFTHFARDGVVTLWAEKHDNNEQPYIKPIFDKIRNEQAFADELACFGVFERRADDGSNVAKPALHGSDYPYLCLVFILHGTDDMTHQEILMTIRLLANRCVRRFNEAGLLFRYPTKFYYYGDKTEEVVPTLDKLLLTNDVLSIIEESYPLDKHPPEVRATYCSELYFSDAAFGYTKIMENSF